MNKLNDIKHEAHHLTSHAYEKVKDKAASTYEKVKKETNQVADKAIQTAEDVYHSAQDQKDHAVTLIRERPFTSVLIAAGVGYLISYLMRNDH